MPPEMNSLIAMFQSPDAITSAQVVQGQTRDSGLSAEMI